jgi:hypothetical protein
MDWSRGSAIDLYSGGIRFEPRPGYLLSLLMVYEVLFVSGGEYLDVTWKLDDCL